MIPWNHLFVKSDKKFSFCCTTTFVDEKSKSFSEFWNSEEMKSLRRILMSGELPPEALCYRCMSERTMKRSFAERHSVLDIPYEEEFLSKTSIDGTTTYIPKTIEIRTDLCNFKCRTCNDVFSTSIRSEKIKNGIKLFSPKPGEIDTLEKAGLTDELLSNLIHANWAGGEPFMSPLHWDTLDRLIELGNCSVRMNYNSNLSMPGNTLNRAVSTLSKFSNIRICLSLDGWGEDGEYIRDGLKNEEFESNLIVLKRECPHIEISLGYTGTSIGLFTLPDVVKLCLAHEIFDVELRKGVFGKDKRHPLSINVLKRTTLVECLDKAIDVAKGSKLESSLKEYKSFMLEMYDIEGEIKNAQFELNRAKDLEKVRGKEGYYEMRMKEHINLPK
jgi:hypothetical protein